jgi:predicted N-acetyltransferase YhbS
MNKMIKIRNEEETDYERVGEITRKSFWNLYIPGCVEHYLVHVMRSHKDFLPELDFVIEVDNQIIGNIMYTKTKLIDESGEEFEIDEQEAERFDEGLESLEKKYRPSQEEFFIYSHSIIQ